MRFLLLHASASAGIGPCFDLYTVLLLRFDPLIFPFFSLSFTFSPLAWRQMLQVLDISNNSLSKLPSSICSLVALVELNISSNHIEKIPDCIGKLSALRILNASSNFIQFLPPQMPTHLEVLDLRDNLIESVPSDLPLQLCSLRSCMLGGNPGH